MRRCRRSLVDYPFLLQLPYNNEYDTRLALLAEVYFNNALEAGLIELNAAVVDGTLSVRFGVPIGASVESSCRPSRTLRLPGEPPASALNDSQRRDRLAEWPELKVFELYSDVWRPWCEWKKQHPELASPGNYKRQRAAAAAAVTPPRP